ncbi:uncharacterized protein PFL1_03161 [Pseudozyma flocculosa PF-1]|uniref:Uncharacterized protein n=1 Tax=Pseudozyma flocculosa PF-1 TaxID=1277687 RepID=A0A061HFK6_9BASI|nr:uncharacterized protein PFL1_03161 [Pseudozyma flocculosa PF-1]EPQ29406.1 hypothetical protein PFL1_03161 [Pseudozyma flocculosa PF-1]
MASEQQQQQQPQQQLDALQLVLSAVRSSPSDPLAPFTLLDAAGSRVDAVTQAETVQIASPSSAEPIRLSKTQPTRLARSKETLASRLSAGSAPSSPDAEPDLFFSVEALLLALQLRDERAGAYLAQAASARVASIPALDRNGILDFLLGKRSEWPGVLPPGGAAAIDAAGTAGGDAGAAGAAGQAPGQTASAGVKRAYVPDRADIDFVKRLRSTYEVVLRTRNDALRGNAASQNGGAAVSRIGSTKNTDFSAFRKEFAAKLDAARKAGGSAGRGGPGSSASSRLPVPSGVVGRPTAEAASGAAGVHSLFTS